MVWSERHRYRRESRKALRLTHEGTRTRSAGHQQSRGWDCLQAVLQQLEPLHTRVLPTLLAPSPRTPPHGWCCRRPWPWLLPGCQPLQPGSRVRQAQLNSCGLCTATSVRGQLSCCNSTITDGSRAKLVSESPVQSLAHLLAAQDTLLEETRPLEWPKSLPVCDSTMQPLHR